MILMQHARVLTQRQEAGKEILTYLARAAGRHSGTIQSPTDNPGGSNIYSKDKATES